MLCFFIYWFDNHSQGAEHGVIFVSFGSIIKVGNCFNAYLSSSDVFSQSSMMPEEKRQLLLKVFSLLKQKIIWKVRWDIVSLKLN